MSSDISLIAYKGPLEFSTINNLLGELKTQMEARGETVVTYKRLLIITVEILENILKYNESHQEQLIKQYPVSYMVLKPDEKFRISAQNAVSLAAIEIISEKIDLVNGMEKENLRKLYQKIISDGKFTEQGGAGLGFIEIAKTSSDKIFYSFEKLNDTLAYFTISITV